MSLQDIISSLGFFFPFVPVSVSILIIFLAQYAAWKLSLTYRHNQPQRLFRLQMTMLFISLGASKRFWMPDLKALIKGAPP